MATEAMVTVDSQGRLSGVTSADAEDLTELAGGTYRCVLTTPKGSRPSKNSLFWMFCGKIAENHPEGFSKKEVGQVLKVECGHSRALKLASGTYVRVAKSIAFDAMTDPDFEQFMGHAFMRAGEAFGHDLVNAILDDLDHPEPMRAAA